MIIKGDEADEEEDEDDALVESDFSDGELYDL